MQMMTQQQHVHLDQRYLVIGLGLTGYSAACYLLRNGYHCSVQDDREHPPYLDQLLAEFPDANLLLQPLTESLIEHADCWIVSPGLSIRNPLIKRVEQSGVRVIGDIELFAEAVNKPVIAITGSNGKTTVTTLVGQMIAAGSRKVAVGGNIGVPALDLLQQDADIYVLELSSFQLETTQTLKPLAATVLNVSEDHMDRYDDLQDYQNSKKKIYQNAKYIISNADDQLTGNSSKDIQFSLQHHDVDYHIIQQPQTMLAVKGEGWINTSELKLKGRHNWANCLVAMALAQIAGISRSAIVETLKQFPGLDHRSQWVADINGVSWINDSKATNPGATLAAIQGIDEPIILLAGGQSKGANMQSLCPAVKEKVSCVLLFGQDADQIEDSLQGCTRIERLDNLAQAVVRAHQIAQTGDLVLLSPACASFDQFKGFADRGEQFSKLVRSLS
jgi:UDP-N-acetylmuramoylalanine--D-glutamate ligase